MQTRKFSWIILLLFSSFFAVSCWATVPGAGFHVLRYELNLTPQLSDHSVRGTETIYLQATTPGLRTVAFTANALILDSATLDSATLNGAPVEHAQQNGALLFTLPEALDAQRTATLRIVYHGTPDSGITFAADSVYTSYDTCSWMVCSEDTPGDKSAFTLDLHLPAGMSSLASGRLVRSSRAQDGSQIDHWRSSRPYSAYLFGFAVGRFTAVRQRQQRDRLLFLSNAATRQELENDLANTGAMVRFLSQKAGVGLPQHSYAQLLVAGDEAQEATSYSILGKDNIDPRDDWAIVHELAHQWWGNLVTCATWKDFWLNEGITVYMTAAWKEHQYGHAAYAAEMDVAQRRVEAVRKQGWDKPLAYGGEYPTLGVRRSVQYSKGALFMERLRGELGDQAFWAGLRLYTRQHAGGTVTSIDLEHAMEQASGHDLSALFAEWVFGK